MPESCSCSGWVGCQPCRALPRPPPPRCRLAMKLQPILDAAAPKAKL